MSSRSFWLTYRKIAVRTLHISQAMMPQRMPALPKSHTSRLARSAEPRPTAPHPNIATRIKYCN